MFWMVVGCTDAVRLAMCDSNLAPRNGFMALGADLIFAQNDECGGHCHRRLFRLDLSGVLRNFSHASRKRTGSVPIET